VSSRSRLIEVTDHLTDPGIGLAAMSALAMSEAGWERLPADVRSAMEEVSAEVPAMQARFLAASAGG
jgi:TRAP-type C4-dicarboxylate transport system substrate-binding protein